MWLWLEWMVLYGSGGINFGVVFFCYYVNLYGCNDICGDLENFMIYYLVYDFKCFVFDVDGDLGGVEV